MDITCFIEKMKKIQHNLLKFISNDYDEEEHYQNLIYLFEISKIKDSRNDIKSILYLIMNIINNHNRRPNIYAKIERILQLFIDSINQLFSNKEKYDFFKTNKRILLFLIKEKHIIIDKYIADDIITNIKLTQMDYVQFFYTEIKEFLDEESSQIYSFEVMSDFEEKRKIGENDDKLCTLIRNDSIGDFISFVNQKDYPLNSEVNHSIYETNNLLLKRTPTLIEYCSFFGSVQIFKYLYLNGVEMTPSLWIYAIHGDNPEIIHILEENNVKPKDEQYSICLKESIKCHHNDIANYIIDNYLTEDRSNCLNEKNFNDNIVSYSLHYHNYLFFPSDFKHKFTFLYLCQYDHLKIVEHFLQTKQVNPQRKIIINTLFTKLSKLFLWYFIY